MSSARELHAASLDLFLGSTCVGCQRPGPALCGQCRPSLELLPMRVWPRPCPPGLPPVWSVAAYDGVVRAALLAHKEEGRLSLATPLGRALALSVLGLLSSSIGFEQLTLVCVPSRRAVVRERGHDPMVRIARACGRSLRNAGVDARTATLLKQTGRVDDQAGLSATDRSVNLDHAFAARRSPRRRHAPIIILDDIITTGATAREATRALIEAAHDVVGVAVVAATQRRLDVSS